LPSDQEKFDLFLTAIDYLTTAGYDFIGLDHFAKPNDPLSQAWKDGTLHRNFQGYSTHADTDLLGFGVSSISHIGDTFLQNHRELHDYANCIVQGDVPVARGYVLTEDDRLRAAVIEKILCNAALSKDAIEDEFGIVFDRYFDSELQR
jgi:oxygen-independent coproporphyrinogen-3 oxidase